MTKKAIHKARAVNDNRAIRFQWGRTVKLRALKPNTPKPHKAKAAAKPLVTAHSGASRAAKATLGNTRQNNEHSQYQDSLYSEDAPYDKSDGTYFETASYDAQSELTPEINDAPEINQASETRNPQTQVIFLLVLGFAITCIATMLYVLATGQHSSLLNILIPAIMISGTFLVAMRSAVALWISLLALTVWSVLGAIAKYNGLAIPAGNWLIALPIILSLQIIAASHSRSQFIMLASLACAYIWLAIFTLGSDLTALASGTLVFILGTAHHRLGKAWGDKGLNYSHTHTLIGWLAAILGLVWAQHYFIPLGDFEANTVGLGADQSFYWMLGIALGLTVIFFSNFIRMRYNRLSFLAFLHVCASCIILPVVAYDPALLTTTFESFTDLPAMPYFGFALGAIVLAFCIGLGMNGLRRRRYADTLIAGLTVCAQTAILLNPNYLTFDTLLVVAFTMMFVLCFELMISRRSILTSPLYIEA